MGRFQFPSRLYAIADTLGDAERSVVAIADALLTAGVPLLQLRCKRDPTRDFVAAARAVQGRCVAAGAALIINDRADIALLVGAAGVHLGQEDLPPAEARGILGRSAIIGVSTHNAAQVAAATGAGIADYLGFGPMFATATKANPDPVQGLDGLRSVRALTPLPVVAIGGITLGTAPEVIATGADAVAVISDLVAAPNIHARTREYLAALA